MDINQDFVPSTVKAAAEHIAESVTDDERELIKEDDLVSIATHHTVGRHLRNGWSLWSADTPLKRDAVETYGIAHADDISGLILDWACALVRGDEFDPLERCERFHEHWKKYGKTSLEAGGWPPKGEGQ